MKRALLVVIPFWLMVLLAGWVAAGNPQTARAENNGLERTPVLGWSSWSFLREHPTAAGIEKQARALHESGLQKLGYEYVNLDDNWYQCPPGGQGPDVGPYGRWIVNPSEFPPQGDTGGIKAVADYVHSLGLKFGIYVTPGISMQAVNKNTPIQGTPYTAAQIAEPSIPEGNCRGMVRIDYDKPGSQEFINSWADMLAGWGVDFIKLDWITDSNVPDIRAWSEAIQQSGRPMILDVTQGNFTSAIAPVLMKYANQWEFALDIECYGCEKDGNSYPLTTWSNVENRFDLMAEWQPYAGPGGFNDYDSIEVGNGSDTGLTPTEERTQMSLWALGASPLILGVDLTHLDPMELHQILENTAVLAVDQDAIAAKRVVKSGNWQVFAKTEANGDVIAGLFNTSEKAEEISINASALGLRERKHGYSLRDLWTGEMKKSGSAIHALVPSHGVALYRISAH